MSVFPFQSLFSVAHDGFWQLDINPHWLFEFVNFRENNTTECCFRYSTTLGHSIMLCNSFTFLSNPHLGMIFAALFDMIPSLFSSLRAALPHGTPPCLMWLSIRPLQTILRMSLKLKKNLTIPLILPTVFITLFERSVT